MKVFAQIIILTYVILFGSCTKDEVKVQGLRPIYQSYDIKNQIKTLPASDYVELGKIVSLGNYIYINEINKGIHVIDNQDPHQPVNLYFWNIPGNTEFILTDNVLYADNGKDLYIIDISNPAMITFVNVIEDQYIYEERELYPSGYSGYFECYDHKKGILVSWETDTLDDPACRVY